jgi:hypothetical protein
MDVWMNCLSTGPTMMYGPSFRCLLPNNKFTS